MCDAERRLGARAFFMMDENVLLHKRRALELLACMRGGGKAWSLYVFSSANAIRQYETQQLVDLGVDLARAGIGEERLRQAVRRRYAGATRDLQQHGICVLGSTIVGMEHHTAENIWQDLDRAIAHDTVFHQFMLSPMPGTSLYQQVAAEGRLLDDVNLADVHPQHAFNFEHPAISREQSKVLLDAAFRTDYERNGPSLYRLMRTMFERYRRYYGHDADGRVRARVERGASQLRGGYAAALWAMERYLRLMNPDMSVRIGALRQDIHRELGGTSRLAAALVGPLLYWSARRDAARHPAGRRLEPRTFVERTNWA